MVGTLSKGKLLPAATGSWGTQTKPFSKCVMKKNEKWPTKMPQKYSKVIKTKLSHLIKNARKSINCEKKCVFGKSINLVS